MLCLVCACMSLSACNKKSTSPGSKSPVYSNYSTYVFFGTDSRAAGDDWKTDDSTGTEGAPSSDVIMLLTVNNDTDEAKILSVYRDTMLDVAGDGTDFEKCNTAYRDGGAYGAIDMLEKNLDLHIDGYVTANFMSVADAIDLLGGVDVDIEDVKTTESHKDAGDDVVDIMNNLIDEMNSIYGSSTPHIEHAGKQTLTGLQSVAYSRVRYTEGSDMVRTERQRNVVALMAQKLKSVDTETQHTVLKEMYKKVDTDMAENELMSLFDVLVDYDLGSMKGFPFHLNRLFDDEKGAMYVPCDLETNVAELHSLIYDNNDYTPSSTVTSYSKGIEEESGMTADSADESLSAYN